MSDYQRWLEGEMDDSDLARLQAGKVNHILDGIKTEAGKRLWTKINDNYGSSVWGPVGDGIVEIEAEVEARIIKLLEDKRCVCLDLTGNELRSLIESDTPMKHANCDYVGLDWVISLIKGEK